MAVERRQSVVFQPKTADAFLRGVRVVVDAIRPTLGPSPRFVAYGQMLPGSTPELLSKAGVVARRITELPDRNENFGAMYVRDVLTQLHDELGDGVATGAVMFESVLANGMHRIASGANAMRLRTHLETGSELIVRELDRQAEECRGQTLLTRIAQASMDGEDPALAEPLGEVFDIIGEHGSLEVRRGQSRDSRHSYNEGSYWSGGVISRRMLTDPIRQRSFVLNAAILISDLQFEDPAELVPVLQAAKRTDAGGLMIVTRKLSDRCLALLLANHDPDRFPIIAVRAAVSPGDAASVKLDDLAVLSGGRRFLQAAGDRAAEIGIEDFGRARRGWADRHYFGIIAGQGDRWSIRHRVEDLRHAFDQAETRAERDALSARLASFLGASATVWVGGESEIGIKQRVQTVESAATAVRASIREGVVPGGGAALFACRAALKARLETCKDFEEVAAYKILLQAVRAPVASIAANSGSAPSPTLAKLETLPAEYGFEAVNREFITMSEAGILDPVLVQRTVARTAIRAAASALTIDVLVRSRNPKLPSTL